MFHAFFLVGTPLELNITTSNDRSRNLSGSKCFRLHELKSTEISAKIRAWDVMWFRLDTSPDITHPNLKARAGIDCSRLCQASVLFFSILTKLRDEINVLYKMTYFGANFAKFQGEFSSITHTYLLLVKEDKLNRGMWFPRCWRSWLRSICFSVRSLPKVIKPK